MKKFLILTAFFSILLLSGCSTTKSQPLEAFSDHQAHKVVKKEAYIQAEFDFWAALYEPTLEDLQALRASWQEHASSFPESSSIKKIEEALEKGGSRVVLLALFMSDWDRADLKDKEIGWSVGPQPKTIDELHQQDNVLRTLMPTGNQWARYYLVQFDPRAFGDAPAQVVVGNRSSRVELNSQ